MITMKDSTADGGEAPLLPPRQPSSTSAYPDSRPRYESMSRPSQDELWSAQDPRSSSTQSLVPSESNEQKERRRLLLIYIHGFMGSEASFHSFPAHVHNLLTVLLVETHVVHTKVYPRYRSKRNISFARDDFSTWLEPHESEDTDVVLLGHSMGGLLSAEVVLMPPPTPATPDRPFKHRILGTINFDVPFLGMHPGIVKSGLASIFNPGEEPAEGIVPISSLAPTDTFWQQPDPNFNQSFNNDVILPMRKGWQSALHFVRKHNDTFSELTKATKQLVTSHLEFGGAMANYTELKSRYGRVRALEEDSEGVRKSVVRSSADGGEAPRRVRFVNYYTASTGRVKKRRPSARRLSPSESQSRTTLSPSAVGDAGLMESESASTRSQSPQISLEEHSESGIVKKEPVIPSEEDGVEDWDDAAETLTIDDPRHIGPVDTKSLQTVDIDPNDVDELRSPTASLSTTTTLSATTSLPPVPDPPQAPPALDTSSIQDPAMRKLVEHEHARSVKAYERSVKDWEKAIRERKRLEVKQEKKAQKIMQQEAKKAQRKDASKANQESKKEMTQSEKEELRLEEERKRMEAEARRLRGEPKEKEEEADEPQPREDAAEISSTPMHESEFVTTDTAPAISRLSSPSPTPSPTRSRSSSPRSSTTSTQDRLKPKKDRIFCTLPPVDSSGQRDPCWVRVFMQNVDEVGAHCGLFFVDERYERLVGEVAERVEGWLREEGDTAVARAYGEEVD